MADYITALWLQHYLLMIYFGLLIGFGVAFIAYRESMSFWLMDKWYTMPLIGRIARYSRDPSHSTDPGWLNVERTLCGDYHKFIHPISKSHFNNDVLYLKKSYDLGRKPVPFWVMALLAVLLIAEGLGFSYLLATWMAREGSQYIQTWLMVAIVLVLCVILMWVMHNAGHQYFRTSLLRSCFRRFKEERGKAFNSNKIALNDDQSVDDDNPDYECCANRVTAKPGDRGSYGWVVIAIIAIVSIAVLSTSMRMSNLRHEQIAATTVSSGDPFSELPTDVTAPQQQADQKAVTDEQAATRSEGLAAFFMLAFIFVITQIVAISAGYKYGFAGVSAPAAYRETRGFVVFASYWAWYGARIRVADARLEALQQALEQHSSQPMNLTKRFSDYYQSATQNDKIMHEEMDAPKNLASATAPRAGAANRKQMLEALRKCDAIDERDAKLQFLDTLPTEIADAVQEELQARKAKAQKQRKWEDLI